MPRVALLILALTLLVVGAGFAFLNGQSSATAVNASPAIAGALQETSLTSTTSPAPAEVNPVSSTMYGSEVEGELAISTSKSDGYSCEGKYSSAGY